MPGTRRRSNTERRDESQGRILDSAEALFAAHGFNGVSVKDIAKAAQVDTSLVHYYFASKAGLFTAVLRRHAPRINQMRMDSMAAYARSAGPDMTVEGVLRAYLEPAFCMARDGGESEQNYMTLIAQISVMTPSALPGVDLTAFDPAIEAFISMLQQVRPDLRREDLYWFYHLLTGAITQSWARTGRIDRLSGGLCRSNDFDTILEKTITVFTHGLAVGDTPRSPS